MMRIPAAVTLAVALAATLTGCSDDTARPAPDHAASPVSSPDPDPTSSKPAPLAPLGSVITDARAVVLALTETVVHGGHYPDELTVVDGRVRGLDVQLGADERVTRYQVVDLGENKSGVRFCVVHDAGPWASYDDTHSGALEHGLAGPCSFPDDRAGNGAGQPAGKDPAPGGPADAHRGDKHRGHTTTPGTPGPGTGAPAAEPRTDEELMAAVAADANNIGMILTEAGKSPGLPEDLAAALKLVRGRFLLASNTVIGYRLYPAGKGQPEGFGVCIGNKVGGWARYDSADPHVISTGIDGTCSLSRRAAAGAPTPGAAPATPSR